MTGLRVRFTAPSWLRLLALVPFFVAGLAWGLLTGRWRQEE